MILPTLPSGSIDDFRRRGFEEACRRHESPSIEAFLPPANDPTYLPTLAELVMIDLEFAWQAHANGAAPRPALQTYVRRFPQLDAPGIHDVLLAHDRSLGDHHDDPTLRPGRESQATATQSTPSWPKLPGYEILERIGRGGMGVVYKARHIALNRIVAIKMLPDADGDQAEARKRFRIEAEAVARLRHPSIVQVYEVGSHGDRPYIVLEFVAGGSLDRLIAGKPQPPRPGARLVAQVARAVHHAHRNGVIHRDLKPANVLLDRVDSGPPSSMTAVLPTAVLLAGTASTDDKPPARLEDHTPKVTDFGLAKQLEAPSQTKTGDVLGTPCYMAPEQARGEAGHIGVPADVYALGAVLYELLTGRPPFQGVTSWATIELVLKSEPVAPSRLQPGLPRDLETICLKCLSKERLRRYSSAEALADDLERFLDDRPINARPAGAAERLVRWSRRNPGISALGGALAAVVIVALIGLTALWLRADTMRATAEANADEARQQQARADANFHKARDAVDQLLARVAVEKLTDVPHFEQVRRMILEDTLAYYRGFLAERSSDPAVRMETGRAFRRVGDIYALLGRYRESEENYRQSHELLDALVQQFSTEPMYRRELGHLELEYGNLLKDLGRTDDALGSYGRAVDQHRRLADDDAGNPERHAGLASTLVAWGSATPSRIAAEQAFRESVNVLSRLLVAHSDHREAPNFRHDLAIAKQHLAGSLHERGQLAESEALLREAVALHDQLIEEFPTWPQYRSAGGHDLSRLGTVLIEAGRLVEAERVLQRAMQLQRRLVADFPNVPEYRADLATTQFSLPILFTEFGKTLTTELVQSHRDAVELHQKLAAEFPMIPRHRDRLASSLESLGRLEESLGKQREAESAFRRAADTFDKLAHEQPRVPRYRLRFAANLSEIGSLLTWTARKREAEELIRRAMTINDELARKAPDVPEHQHQLGNRLYSLAILLRNTDRVAEAGDNYQRCLEIYDRLARDFPAVRDYRLALANTHISRGIVLVTQQRYAEAEAGYRKAIELLDRFAAEYSSDAKFLSLKAAVLDNTAESLLARGEPAQARTQVEEAIKLELAALTSYPRHPQYLRFLASHYEVLGRAAIATGDRTTAANAASELAARFPDNASQLRTAAGLAAQCVSLAEVDQKLNESERRAKANEYADQAMDCLRLAVKAGFRNTADLKNDAILTPLRNRSEFQQLLGEMEKRF